MKRNIFSGVVFLILSPFCIFGQNNNSMNLDANQNSININPGFVIGSELGTALRVEYEKGSSGKIMLNGLGGIYLQDGDFLMYDLGLGYGYPVVKSKSNAFFINGFLTAMIQSIPLEHLHYQDMPIMYD